jgi:dihydrofolate reductase
MAVLPTLPRITLVVAHDRNLLIGGNNTLLWHLPDDLQHFKALTTGGAIAMGRLTFDSIGRPLPKRLNLVVSRNTDLVLPGAQVFPSLPAALQFAQQEGHDEVFVVGGGTLYAEALPLADRLEITEIDAAYTGDTWFPEYRNAPHWQLTQETHHPADDAHAHAFVFRSYTRRA